MNNLKKPIGIISKILFALMLALALLNVTSCENILGNIGSSQGTGQGNDGQDNEPDNPQDTPKNHYSDYENFNKANYPIVNGSGKSDSEIAELKDLIWLMYAENEDVGEWTAKYVKTNKIKTILSNEWGGAKLGYIPTSWIDFI